ncbi:hypothetical protein BG004_003960 [Podila humilis]|nr:hypothetical protein BG004_003960 [Podila humilis]
MDPRAIFDIILIVDTICQDLSLRDIQACRGVNRQCAAIFRPHLWCASKIRRFATQERFDRILENKKWIRSLTISSDHALTIAQTGLFTHLEELAFYDNDYYFKPGCDNAILQLIESNINLQSLHIDLSAYHYQPAEFGRSTVLSHRLLLTIARCVSLTRLTWIMPYQLSNEAFAQCLLNLCHGSIQYLTFSYRYLLDYDRWCYSPTFPFRGHYFTRCIYDRCFQGFPEVPFSYGGFDGLKNGDDDVELTEFCQKIQLPLDSLGRPFALKELFVPACFDADMFIQVLSNSPHLERTRVLFDTVDNSTKKIQAAIFDCRAIKTLDFRHGDPKYDNYGSTIKGSPNLQRCFLPYVVPSRLKSIIRVLAETSLDSLQELGLNMKSLSDESIVSILRDFPNLKELDFGSVKIYVGDRLNRPSDEPCSQTGKELGSEKTIASHWECPKESQIQCTIVDWWSFWVEGVRFMNDVRREYRRQFLEEVADNEEKEHQEGPYSYSTEWRSIRMQFMYPIQEFRTGMRRHEVQEEVNATRLTLSDASKLVALIQEEERLYYYGNYDLYYDMQSMNGWNGWHGNISEYEWAELKMPCQEYELSKSRNRHHSRNGRKRSIFRRPFKK